MSDQKVPQAPDYSPVINAYNAISQHATDMGNQAYEWAKGQVANNQNLVDQIKNGLLDVSGSFQNAGKGLLDTATGAIKSGTDYLTRERDRFTDPSYVQNDMGAAEAQTGQAFDAARNSSIQELESYGVNPGATRFAGLDAGIRAQKAAAQAAAGTTAARQDQAQADAANDKLVGAGTAGAGTASNLTGTGTNAGQGAVSNSLANTASGANVLGTDLAWTGTRANALSGQTNAMNTSFNNQATADKAANDSSSGIGSLLGLGMSAFGKGGMFGAGGAFSGGLSSVAPFFMLAEGGEVPDANDGGAIPSSASPSGGAVTDDIPAQSPGHPNIRLNGGEFIIPKDVAGFMGEKFFVDTINKARKAMGPGMAQQGQPRTAPAVGGMPGGQPPGGQGPMQRMYRGGAIPEMC